MANPEREFNEDDAYRPEKIDKNTKLLAPKPQDEFLLDDNVTLITMENVKKLDEWEKKEKERGE